MVDFKNVSEDNFYILPDVGTEMAKLEEKAKAGEDVLEEVLMRDFAVKVAYSYHESTS